MLPASVAVTLFFVIPVFMTFVFSFTTMSSDTGILGNRYIINEATILDLTERDVDASLVKQLGSKVFAFDKVGLAAVGKIGLKPPVAKEIEEKLSGQVFGSEKELFAALKSPPRNPRRTAS